MGKALLYSQCPFCYPTVYMQKDPETKHVYRCPRCGFNIAPNQKKGSFKRTNREKLIVDCSGWHGL